MLLSSREGLPSPLVVLNGDRSPLFSQSVTELEACLQSLWGLVYSGSPHSSAAVTQESI